MDVSFSIKDKDEAKAYFLSWMENVMGYEDEVMISVVHQLQNRRMRPAWEFECISPCGVFFVFRNRDVEDNYGVFNNRVKTMYDKNGKPIPLL